MAEVVLIETLTPLGSFVVSLLGAILALIVGYFLGIQRARYERRDERRDIAIAEIYGAMWANYRDFILWARGDSPEKYERVSNSMEDFLTCYYSRSIWLGEDTREIVEGYAQTAKDFYNGVQNQMGRSGTLADGTKAIDLLNEQLEPAFDKAEKRLRDEVPVDHPWYLRPFG